AKMRRAQERMRAARPYAEKIRNVAAHLSRANPEYKHAFLVKRESEKNVGLIVVTSDKGLCGGLNTNLLRLAVNDMKEWEGEGKGLLVCPIGNKGFGFMNRIGAKVQSHLVGIGDVPHVEKLIGTVKAMLDAYVAGEIDAIYLGYNHFINTMRQEPRIEQLLPLPSEKLETTSTATWDYIYEPDAKKVIDDLLLRYIESLVYQAVVENIASEQSSRMVAMKAASDNAKSVISELKLVYNKARQAAITKEISEIVGGAAALA
ncbi:MAG: F0F1 ATP synthase subunit gamma, partial [Sideroxydans sp.]